MLKTAAPDRIAFTHAEELRGMWQSRILRATEGYMRAVVLSMLAHSYRDAMSTLLKVTYGPNVTLRPPLLSTCGKIQKNGTITAVVRKADNSTELMTFFPSVDVLQGRFRALADRMKLNDEERVEMFGMVQRWLVVDFRKGPNGEDLSE